MGILEDATGKHKTKTRQEKYSTIFLTQRTELEHFTKSKRNNGLTENSKPRVQDAETMTEGSRSF